MQKNILADRKRRCKIIYWQIEYKMEKYKLFIWQIGKEDVKEYIGRQNIRWKRISIWQIGKEDAKEYIGR